MATYKGNDIVQPDRLDEDRKLMGKRYRGFDNVDEELGLPESAEPDYVPRPGQKGYLETKPEAQSRLPFSDPDVRHLAAQEALETAAKTINQSKLPHSDQDIVVKEIKAMSHQQGGPVRSINDQMPPDQRKLSDRVNVNEMMQTRDDIRMGGPGTSREGMPGPPISVAYPESPNLSQGGRVQKYGSDTCIVCKDKFS
jgi:hypothetical protein